MSSNKTRIFSHMGAAYCGAAAAVLAVAILTGVGTCAFKDEGGTGGSDDFPVCVTTGEHIYGEPVWTWQENNSGAVAVFTCSECGTKELAVATVGKTLTSVPQCTENDDGTSSTVDGEAEYTALAVFNGSEYSDIKKESVPYELTFGVIDCDNYVDYSLNGIATTSKTEPEVCSAHTSVGIFVDDANLDSGKNGKVLYTVSGTVYEETTLAAYLPESDFKDLYITFSPDADDETKYITYYPINYSLSLIEWKDGAPQARVIGSGSLKDISQALGTATFDYSAGDAVSLCFVLSWEWKWDNGYIGAGGSADVYSGILEGMLWQNPGTQFTATSYAGRANTYYLIDTCADWGFTFVIERV